MFSASPHVSDTGRSSFRLPNRLWICLALALTLIGSFGCSAKKGGGPAAGIGAAAHMFVPLDRPGSFALSASEAESLALKMHAASQGLRGWNDLDFAVGQSLAHASSRPANRVAVERPGLSLTYGRLAESLAHLRAILPRLDNAPGLLARDFTWYRLGPDFGFTGYYEPTLQASRTRSAAYPYPLYKRPPDLRKGVPYHTRHDIDRRGRLAGKKLELCWVSSETDAFFLHIQGSGRLRYSDGSVTHALYADKNNRAYVPLGRILRDEGLIDPENVNMNSIRECLVKYPERKAEWFDKNPSYVFFREAPKGPLGSMGRPLTPWVSLATDRNVLPHGSLIFAALPLPDAKGAASRPFYGLSLPQDSGGAIKGNRIDLFCGPGEQAEHSAGYLYSAGAVYLLVKKQ